MLYSGKTGEVVVEEILELHAIGADRWIYLEDALDDMKEGEDGAEEDVLENCAELRVILNDIEAIVKARQRRKRDNGIGLRPSLC